MATSIKILLLCSIQLFGGYYSKTVPSTYEGKVIKVGRADPLDVKIFEASITSSNGKYFFDYPSENYYGDHVNFLTIDSNEYLTVQIVKGAINSRSITLSIESTNKNEFEAKITLVGAFLLRDLNSIDLNSEEFDQVEPQSHLIQKTLIGIGKAQPLDVKVYEKKVHSKHGKVVFDYASEEKHGDLVNYLTVDSDTYINSKIVKGGVNQRYLSIELASPDRSEFDATVTLIGAFILRPSFPLLSESQETETDTYKGKNIEIGRADQYDVEIYKENMTSNRRSIIFNYPFEGEYGDLVNHVSVDSDDNLILRILKGGVGERFISFELESIDTQKFKATVSLVGAFILRRN